MNIILLSGGSGKRLWPLSNENRSKQFLRLLRSEIGEPESMVQRIYRQLCETEANPRIIVATVKTQVDSIISQLGRDVDIVLEPERRDTFPAIALAASYLVFEKGVKEDEPVVILPVDPYTETSYFALLHQMTNLVKDGTAEIALMGIRPTYSSTRYGYIVPGAPLSGNEASPCHVEHFVEKPSPEYAKALVAKGALWNGGVFAFKLEYILKILRQYIHFDSYHDVMQQYSRLPRVSFDYGVIEKEPSLAMLEFSGQWEDLGTWNALTEVMNEHVSGKVILADDCENTNVINELDIPIIVAGTHNLVVAASPDGILVSDKLKSSELKKYVDQIDQRPMFEERRWGEYKVLDYVRYSDGEGSLTKHMTVRGGEHISYQRHASRDEIWTIVDGTGELLVDGKIRHVRRGDVAFIPRGMKHAIRATEDLHIVEVQIGMELIETDIERFEWTW